MKTGNLTPRTNSTIREKRYSGGFGQPDGFASVLNVAVRTDGRLVLTLRYRPSCVDTSKETLWSVELTNEQRKDLEWITEYEPILVEDIKCG